MHGNRKSVGDDLQRRGRRIFKAQFPRPLDEDLAFGALAVGADLDEIAGHIGGGIKISVGLLDGGQGIHRNKGGIRLDGRCRGLGWLGISGRGFRLKRCRSRKSERECDGEYHPLHIAHLIR